MSIPKKIHYCWLGRNPKPKSVLKCIESWKKFCPDYEIIEWNEDNLDISSHLYSRQAYEAKAWAFATDYFRLWIVYTHGGIYLDTDVELLKPLDALISETGYMGFDENELVATGLGFACEKGNALIGALLKDYDDIPFVLADGTYDMIPCPDRNTETIKNLGLNTAVKNQVFMGIHFLPEDYLCPIKYYTGKKVITPNTYSIHHFCASWTSATAKRTLFLKRLIGVKLYDKLYGKFLYKLKWLEW